MCTAGQYVLSCREVKAAYTGGFMESVTCGLNAEDRDQLRNPTFLSSMVYYL